MNNLSENLKKIRKDNHMSQEQLADELGVSRQAISKWESGTAYPEMEKIIQICKKFELNIDDLLNKDIREVKNEQYSKNNMNKFIDDFLHYIIDSINLFLSMNGKTKIKCLLEQILIAFLLTIILLIIGKIGQTIIQSIFYHLVPYSVYNKIYGILGRIYLIVAFIISILLLVHIFKIRYLDYYRNMKTSIKENDDKMNQEMVDNNDTIAKKDKTLFENNEKKIIIRDPKHSEYKFINEIFKILILFIKFFALFFALSICALLVMFTVMFIISFTIIKTGLFFVGLLLCTASLIVGCMVVILWLFNFIFNRKNDKKKMVWSFISAIIVFGIGCGLVLIGSLKFNVIDYQNMLETKQIEVDMDKDLTIINDGKIEYMEKNIDNIIIEYEINKSIRLDYEIQNLNNKKVFRSIYSSINLFEIIRTIIEEINKYNIININNDVNMKIYASKNNIELLKANKIEYDATIKKENDYYQQKMNKLENTTQIKQE